MNTRNTFLTCALLTIAALMVVIRAVQMVDTRPNAQSSVQVQIADGTETHGLQSGKG